MNAFTIIVEMITSAAALVTVYYAWRASRESRAATQAAQQTANIAAAAATEYVHWRHQDHLRAIAHYVADIARKAEEIESAALAHADAGCAVWRSPSQEHLDISMKGMRIPLPRCRGLAHPLGPVLLSVPDHERIGLVARMAIEAAKEVEQRPELYAPVVDPLADVRPDAATSAPDRRTGEAAT
jgi:hypothetical protein